MAQLTFSLFFGTVFCYLAHASPRIGYWPSIGVSVSEELAVGKGFNLMAVFFRAAV